MTQPVPPDFYAGARVQVDDVQALSDQIAAGWTAYTPALTNCTGTAVGQYRWVNADTIAVHAQVTLNAAATGTVEIGLPAGVTLDTTVTQLGDCAYTDASPFGRGAGSVFMSASTFSRLIFDTTTATGANATYPITWASGDVIVVGGEFAVV